MEILNNDRVLFLIDTINNEFGVKFGFNFHPFLLGWYNEKVIYPFQLNYDPNTFAILAISTPSMFENTFIPYLNSSAFNHTSIRDPLDEACRSKLSEITKLTSYNEISKSLEVIFDYELQPNRAPRILMQTAGHVSGVTYYYQKSHIINDPWSKDEPIYGVSIHPKYGGWFAFRAVFIFRNLIAPDLPRKIPFDCIKEEKDRIELLNRFNRNWRDWTYRDVVPAIEKYSELQKLYFSTAPENRSTIIDDIIKASSTTY